MSKSPKIKENEQENAIQTKKEKGPKKPKIKRNQKLLIQVGIIIGVIFSMVIGVSAFILVKGSIDTYLESKQEFMKPIAEKLKGYYDYLARPGVFFDLWLEEPNLVTSIPITDAGNTYNDELIADFPIVGVNNEFELPDYDPDELENYTQRQRFLLASYMYQDIWLYEIISLFQSDHQRMMCIDVSDEHWGAVYHDINYEELQEIMALDSTEASEDDVGFYHLGEDYSDILKEIKSIDKVKEYHRTVFERYESRKDGNYYYLCVMPIVSDNEVRAVLVFSYDWSDFHSSLMKKLIILVVVSGLVLVLASVLLLFFINRSAIRPLARVQQGVREYMVTKNSQSIVDQLSEIRQRNEFGVLADDVSHMVVEINRHTYQIAKLSGERERVATELSLAANIQMGVLPVDFPKEKDYELYASMTPAKEVGGDLYDFFDIDETHIGLVIGDVSGKGVPASLFMMIAKLLIQEYGRTETSAATVLAKANKTLCANNTNDMFVTAWFGILDRTTGKITAASAGHEFPIMRDPDGEYRLIKDRHGFVLGAMDISKYKEYELELKPGGTLLVYSDGAPEATNASDELFGTDRMLEAMNKYPEDHPKEVIEHLTEAINEFVGDAPQFDDLTMLCIRYNGWEN